MYDNYDNTNFFSNLKKIMIENDQVSENKMLKRLNYKMAIFKFFENI